MPDNEPYIVGNMFGEYHALCTLKTSIVDFGKEREHCSLYESQHFLFLRKSPHLPSSPPWPITVIIGQTIYHKSLTIFVTYTLYRVHVDIARIELAAFTVGMCTDWQCQFKTIHTKKCFPFNNK